MSATEMPKFQITKTKNELVEKERHEWEKLATALTMDTEVRPHKPRGVEKVQRGRGSQATFCEV